MTFWVMLEKNITCKKSLKKVGKRLGSYPFLPYI